MLADGRRHGFFMKNDRRGEFSFVTCATNLQVLKDRLLSSPCLSAGRYPLTVHFNAPSAAHGFNATLLAEREKSSHGQFGVAWLVWVHQDVFLPPGWDLVFEKALTEAQKAFSRLAVVGVYGLEGVGANAQRAGNVLDRGKLLQEPAQLPCRADSLDELLFAVRIDSGLQLDPALGFDFYATDLVLQAQALGLQSAVLDAFCEHWSSTPASGPLSQAVVERIQSSAVAFERKWTQRMPITTPCFHMNKPGDVAAFLASLI